MTDLSDDYEVSYPHSVVMGWVAERDALRARLETEEELLRDVLALIDEQAEDDALWFVADSIVEAYLQQELRRLTAAIEEPARAFVARNVA